MEFKNRLVYQYSIYGLETKSLAEIQNQSLIFLTSINFTCDAKEKLGPGDLFFPPTAPGPPPGPPPALLGAFCAAPFLFLLLLVGLADSEIKQSNPTMNVLQRIVK